MTAALMAAGLVPGGLAGGLTRPKASELKLGPVFGRVECNRTAAPGLAGVVTLGQWQPLGAVVAIGTVSGLGAGLVPDRRRA